MNLVLFNKGEVVRVIKALGYNVNSNGEVISKEGKKVTCQVCGDVIKTSNLGNVMPGSKHFFCDDPTCFAGWVAEKWE